MSTEHEASAVVENVDGDWSAPNSAVNFSELPTLYADKAFWGMVVTQFLGAFNDNLFKQLMLLLALKVAVVPVFGLTDLQGLATFIFAAPFVVLSGFAGFLSDRYSKRPIIIWSKVAEIVVMLLGLGGFLFFAQFGFSGLLVVLFLMGLQSTFFGPGKYGVLPEMLRPTDLPRANGVMLMTTFLAIISGTVAAGILTDPFLKPGVPLVDAASSLWRGSAVCIGIAIVGTLTSLLVRSTPAANRRLKFSISAFTVTQEMRAALRQDRQLLIALLASCMFWGVAGITQPAVNALGVKQLEIGDFKTSLLAGAIGVGIAGGAIIAGRLCRGRADFRIVRVGAWGCVIFLAALALPGREQGHLLGFGGSLAALIMLGVAAAFFAIPLQVFLQSRPPKQLKGRMIAVMNQANFVAILLSGIAYTFMAMIVHAFQMPEATIFALTAVLMLPVALFYRPSDLEA